MAAMQGGRHALSLSNRKAAGISGKRCDPRSSAASLGRTFPGQTEETSMSNNLASLRRPVLLGSAALVAMAFTLGSAAAGQCPAGKQMADATKPVDMAAQGVKDTVLAAINLAEEPAMVQDRTFRLRRLVIEPGGVVPWHSHG